MSSSRDRTGNWVSILGNTLTSNHLEVSNTFCAVHWDVWHSWGIRLSALTSLTVGMSSSWACHQRYTGVRTLLIVGHWLVVALTGLALNAAHTRDDMVRIVTLTLLGTSVPLREGWAFAESLVIS